MLSPIFSGGFSQLNFNNVRNKVHFLIFWEPISFSKYLTFFD